MAAQNKRSGRAAQLKRKQNARAREPAKVDVVIYINWAKKKNRDDIRPGWVVAWAEVKEAL